MYGLIERDITMIVEVAKKHSEVQRVVLFGSRAMGNFKKGSDVDVALVGQKVDRKTVQKVSDELNEEYPLPYFFDVINYDEISNKELQNHIDQVGKTIYSR